MQRLPVSIQQQTRSYYRLLSQQVRETVGETLSFIAEISTVITAIDPLYREIGLRETAMGSSLSGQKDVVSVVFESLARVDFGVISRTGSGEASFGVEPFGYQSVSVTTSRVASGTANAKDKMTSKMVVSNLMLKISRKRKSLKQTAK